MANVTEIESSNGSIPHLLGADTEKRRPGRPKGSKTRNNQPPPPLPTDDEDEPLPAAARTRVDRDIWLELANYKPADWDRTIAYLYRVAPTVDRRSGGRPINIRKYAGPFDKDRIMLDEGSGVYRIDILNIDQTTGEYKRWAKEYFDILNMDYPPRVPPGDWIDDPANEVWKWAGPKLIAQQQQQNGVANMYPPGFSMKEQMDMVERFASKSSGSDVLVGKLIDAALNKPAPAAPLPPDNSAFNLIIEELRADRKELREELKELRNKATTPQKNLLEQIKEIQPALLAAKELMGDSKPGAWWENPLQTIVEGVSEAIPGVLEMINNGKSKPAPHAWTPPQTNPQALPAAPPPHGPPPQATTATTAPAEDPNLTPEQRTFLQHCNKWGMFVVHIAPQMMERFKDPDGLGGFYFRDWFLEGHGMFKWADMRRELGPGVLGQMIAEHPQLSVEIGPEQQRMAFLEQFFTLPVDEEEESAPSDGVIEIGGNSAA